MVARLPGARQPPRPDNAKWENFRVALRPRPCCRKPRAAASVARLGGCPGGSREGRGWSGMRNRSCTGERSWSWRSDCACAPSGARTWLGRGLENGPKPWGPGGPLSLPPQGWRRLPASRRLHTPSPGRSLFHGLRGQLPNKASSRWTPRDRASIGCWTNQHVQLETPSSTAQPPSPSNQYCRQMLPSHVLWLRFFNLRFVNCRRAVSVNL